MNRRQKREQAHRDAQLKAKAQVLIGVAIKKAEESAKDNPDRLPTAEQVNQAIDQALSAHRATGPRTPEGKERSSQNSYCHGLTCSFNGFKFLPGESAQEFHTMRDDLDHQFRPRTNSERAKIEDMARSWWMMRRAQTLLTTAIGDGDEHLISLYNRYEASQRRGYQMAYKDFKDMKDARLSQKDQKDNQPLAESGYFQSEPTYESNDPKTQAAPDAPPDRQAA